jgi:hypothetical protein
MESTQAGNLLFLAPSEQQVPRRFAPRNDKCFALEASFLGMTKCFALEMASRSPEMTGLE